jgi:hypothetical protein
MSNNQSGLLLLVLTVLVTACLIYALATGNVRLKRYLVRRSETAGIYWFYIAILAAIAVGLWYFLMQALATQP